MSYSDVTRLIPLDTSDDNVNFHEIWQALLSRSKTIIAVTVIFTLVGLAFVLRSHPQFTTVGSLYTGGLKQSASDGADPSNSNASSYMNYLATFQSVSDSETQINLLTSGPLVQQTVLATGLNTSVTNATSSSPRYWEWELFHHGDVSAYATQGTDLQALYASFADPSVVKAKYKILFGQSGQYEIKENNVVVLDGHLGQPAAGNGLRLLLQASAANFVPASGSSYNLVVTNPAVAVDSVINGHLSVTSGGTATLPSDVINLAFTWPNPYQGKLFIDQLMSNYISTILSWNAGSAGAMEDFITSQLNNVRTQLTDADQKLAAYQEKTGILSPPDNAKDLIEQKSIYEAQRTQAQIRVTALQQIWQALVNPQNGVNPYLLSQASDTSLSQLSEKLAEENATLGALRVQFTGNAQDVQTEQAKVTQLQAAIRSMVKNELGEAQSNLDILNDVLTQFGGTTKQMPAQSLQVIGLTRSSNLLGQLYVLLMQKQQEAALSKAAAVSGTRILAPGQLPLSASQPKAAIIVAFSFIVGLFGSIMWVLGQRALSGRFGSESEIRRRVKLPVYGAIPMRSKTDGNTLLGGDPYSAFSEAFRITRNNLYHALPGKQSKIILITSAAVGNGKSTVASNLAKSLADDGKRVVLVDGDLRMGHMHRSLYLSETPGLSDWLVTSESVALQTPKWQRFAVLTSGVKPPNPAELINEPSFPEILKEMQETYDFIIFDSAPLPAVSDAVTLARYADLTLSVVQIGQSTHRNVTLHQNILGPLSKHHGVIINGIADTETGYDHAYGEIASRRHKISRPAKRVFGLRALYRFVRRTKSA